MKITTVKSETIDANRARQLLELFPYERQRKISNRYVKYYSDMMRRGEWLPGSEIDIAFAPNGDGSKHGHIVNGRHRLWALINADMTLDFVVKEYDCSDETEIAHLYGMLDIGRQRNISDLVRALDLEHEFGFAPSNNEKLGAAVLFLAAGFQRREKTFMSPGERIEWMRRYSEPASVYYEILADSGRRNNNAKMRTSSVMSVALVTLDEATIVYGDERIEQFWAGIATNDGLKIGDPRKVAHDMLFATVKSNNVDHKKFTSPAYISRYIAHCFNAWAENRQITFTRVNDISAPINIVGTQFRG